MNKWIIHQNKYNERIILHKHKDFYFHCYRFYLGSKFSEDIKGPLCGFCKEMVPDYILFQLKLLEKEKCYAIISSRDKIVAFALSKYKNLYARGYVYKNTKYSNKYIYPELGKKKKIILEKLFDEFLSKYR